MMGDDRKGKTRQGAIASRSLEDSQ